MKLTKKYKFKAIFCILLSICLTLGPIVVYSVKAFSSSEATVVNKITLMSMIASGLIIVIITVFLSTLQRVKKATPRCLMWLIIIGLFLCLDNFIGVVLVIAITQCVDELIVHPLAKIYLRKWFMHKEMDKRL